MSLSTLAIGTGTVAAVLIARALFTQTGSTSRTKLIPPTQERVVIVGASSGIGSELARIYAHRGAHIVIVARRESLLQQLVDELSPVAGAIHAVQGDVTLPNEVQRITRESLEALQGRVDTLILCAGIISVLPFDELAGINSTVSDSVVLPSKAQEAFEASIKIMNVNYHAPLNLTTHFLPTLTKSSSAGNIMVVSSMAGKVGAPTRAIYCASKHAAQGFFEALGMEVERTGVHVGIVSPGTVATDLRQSAVDLPKNNAASSSSSSAGPSETKPIAGTKKGAMTARACAEGIVRGSDLRQHEVIMPWFYHVSLVLQIVSPGLVRWLAKKKYGYL
ncbi:hypothetical protein EMPS_11299 [Entomortierella parvispora]|uniref:NAD(P)-binding protein n=1 Tax=Entomortierella parvispora TaxID=205924 RepID=A0A9P3M2F3_9FUNG|nr:hypothetical protein EMPS_11299 [Entomortierella parvispora]